ncbi:hybrid sensor histidine kinase/response regulator [Burkholderia sp. SRS-46]|nr:hybrid sensor histidine kinase/response regulator [Burkholderia sp. SRS-46]
MHQADPSAQSPRDEHEAIDGERGFRALAEAIPHIVWTADPDGSIDFVNQRGLDFGGITLSQAQGWDNWSPFVHPDDLQRAYDRWALSIATGDEFMTEYRLRSADGGYRWFLCRALPYRDRDGKIVKWFGTETDIDAQKQAQAVAERANRAKSDFLSSMSHELRSPLNAILGFAQLMASDSPPPTPSQQASIDQILRAGWHLLELINEVLDLARIESGQVPMSLEAVPLSEMLDECASMVAPQARQRGIDARFPPVGPLSHVRADRTRIKQVVVNLLSNAIKYNRPAGTVDVACATHAPGRVRISVRDTGPGLSPDQLGRLFQPFERLGQEAGAEEGTGIGLVVAKRLTELMGGAIGVDSTVGEGSVFWIELDAAAAPGLAPSAATQPAAPAGDAIGGAAAGMAAHTVLYIEDNPANLKLVEQLVARRADLHMLSAATGLHGVELARRARPRVIVMDINLPDISGIDALAHLRAHAETAAIPVVALSSNAMARDIEKGLKAGFFRYLTKPIRIDQFMQALADAVAAAVGRP